MTNPSHIIPPVAWRLVDRRGPRRRFDSLVSRMAEHRTCYPGVGGSWDRLTGDGEACRSNDRVWFQKRQIKHGQFIGPWRYERQ